jgi:hypothetical protein
MARAHRGGGARAGADRAVYEPTTSAQHPPTTHNAPGTARAAAQYLNDPDAKENRPVV